MTRFISEVDRAALYLVLTILFVFNVPSGIVSGIWLAVLGKWPLIGVGLLLLFLMPTVWSVIAAPGYLLGALVVGSSVEKRSGPAIAVTGFITSLYTHALLGAWVVLVFWAFTHHMAGTLSIPAILWTYTTVTSPVFYMATQEPPESIGTRVGCLFVEIAFILLLVLRFAGVALSSAIYILSALAVMFSLGVTALAIATTPPEEASREYDDADLNL